MRTKENTFYPHYPDYFISCFTRLTLMTRRTLLLILFFTLSWGVQVQGQDVIIKDSDEHVLMQINDEGRVGSITFFPTTIALRENQYLLYNLNDDLIWNGLKLGTANEAAGWRFSSPELTLLDNTYEVGIGTSAPLGKLHIRQESTAFAFRVDDEKDDLSPFIIDDEGNVGVGTSIPSQKLEITGKLKLGNDVVAESSGVMRFNDETDEFEGFNGTSWISFGGGGKWLSNGRKIYYDQGYVGIGNINPGYPLEVTRTNTSDNNTPIATFKSEGFNSAGSLRVENSVGNYWVLGTLQDPDNSLSFNYKSNNILSGNTFKVTPQGNVGIGTANPEQKLEVVGKLKLGNDVVAESSGVMRFNDETDEFEGFNGTSWISFGGGGKWLSNSSDIYFNTGNVGIGSASPLAKFYIIQKSTSDAFRVDDEDADATPFIIDDDGKVGMGTAAPLSKLHVEGNTENEVDLMVNNIDATGNQRVIFGTNPSTDAGLILFNNSSTGLLPGKFRFFNNRPSGQFEWLTGGLVKMVLTDDDRLGVGDVSPSAKTHIAQINAEDAFRVDDMADDPTPFIVKDDGDVGIGIINPAAKTHIAQYASDVDAFRVDDEASDTSPFVIKDSGNVGIGTTSPATKLHVNGYISLDEKLVAADDNGLKLCTNEQATRLAITDSGDIGIGIIDAQYKLHVNSGGSSTYNAYFTNSGTAATKYALYAESDVAGDGNKYGVYGKAIASPVQTADDKIYGVRGSATTDGGASTLFGVYGSVDFQGGPGSAALYGLSSGVNHYALYADGNAYFDQDVRIGHTDDVTGYKLSVNGKIISEELKVQLKSLWPDYVFSKDYKLMPFTELRDHIEQKGHLPGVPTAKEVNESNGILVGEMNRILLEKIEELTLYMLEQDREIQELKQQIKNLQK